MKTAVIYYSMTGNNQLLAQHLARKLDCQAFPVVEEKHRSSMTTFLDVALQRQPKLKPLPVAIDRYDHLVFVAPVWNARVANPMSALIKRERAQINHWSFASLCGYHRPGQDQKLMIQLANLTHKHPEAIVEFALADRLPERDRKDPVKIYRYRANEADLKAFEPEIDEFLRLTSPPVPTGVWGQQELRPSL